MDLGAPGAEKQKTAHALAAVYVSETPFRNCVPHIEQFIAQAP